MVDFVKVAATAKRLVEANGRSVTLYKDSRTPADSAKPWRGPDDSSTEESDTVIAAFVPPRGTFLSGFFRDNDSNLVRDLNQIALVAASSASGKDLTKYDSLLDGDRTWKIRLVERLRPGGTDILWVLGLRS